MKEREAVENVKQTLMDEQDEMSLSREKLMEEREALELERETFLETQTQSRLDMDNERMNVKRRTWYVRRSAREQMDTANQDIYKSL